MAMQYVILAHDVNGETHFDLLLEIPGQERLRTIQLEAWPLTAGESCPARELPPHRRLYLDYEGEISGGRGRVKRVERGTWRDSGDALELNPQSGPARRLSFDGSRIAMMSP